MKLSKSPGSKKMSFGAKISIDPLMKLTSLKNLTVSNCLLLNIPKEIE